MTDKKLLAIAKKSKCVCAACNCQIYTQDGRPVFGNGAYDPKITIDGQTLCAKCAATAVSSGTATVWTIPEWTEPGRISDYQQKIDVLKALPTRVKGICYGGSSAHTKYRFVKENDTTVFVYAPKRKNRGWRYSYVSFAKEYDLSSKVCNPVTSGDVDAKWHKRIDRAINTLTLSGLWPQLLTKLRNLNTMTYEDRKAIAGIYWDHWDKGSDYSAYAEKYPFVFYQNDKGETCVDTFYIYEISELRLKPMYFGKHCTEAFRENIAKHISARQRYSCNARTSYDVSFSYVPESNSAYYAEEYKGCGNGHYYMAISETTAWFAEDD